MGGGGLVNPLKKGNSWQKKFFFFFSDNVEWSSTKNLWKVISADVKAKKNQQ